MSPSHGGRKGSYHSMFNSDSGSTLNKKETSKFNLVPSQNLVIQPMALNQEETTDEDNEQTGHIKTIKEETET